MSVRRRRGILLAAALAVAALCFTLPGVARWWIERRLAAASGMLVRVRALEPTWEPLGIGLSAVELRTAAEGPPVLFVGRLEVPLRGGRMRVIGAVLSLGGVGAARALESVEEHPAGRHFALADAELVAPAIEIASPDGAAATRLALPDASVEHIEGDVLPDGGMAAKGRLDLAGGSVDGRLRLGAAGAARIAADLHLTKVAVERLGAVAASFGLEAGALDGRLRYRGFVAGGAGRVRGRLSGAGIRAAGPGGGWRLQLGEVALAGLDVDLARRRFAVRRAAFEGGELVQAKGREEAGSAPQAGWTGSLKALEGRSLLLRSEAVAGLPALELVRFRGRDLDEPTGTFSLQARAASGGEIRANGELDVAVPRFRADVELDRVALGPWVEPFMRDVRIASGSLGGRFEIAGPPGIRGKGDLRLDDLRAAVVDGGEPRDLAGLASLSASVRGFTFPPPRVWLTSAEVAAPSLTFTRRASGLEPLTLLAAADGDEAAARESFRSFAATLGEAPPLSLPSIEVKVQMRDGRLRFVDEEAVPRFAIDIDGFGGTLAAWGGPPWGTLRADVAGRVDGVAPLAARADIDGQRFALQGEVAKLPLAPWTSYLAPTIGYAATAGQASASFDLEWEKEVHAPIRLALEGVALERRSGEDRLGAVLGMPLEHALDLMTDSAGRSELVLRLEGEGGAPALGLVAALPGALREAVPEAVSVPLFQGSETLGSEESGSVRLAPLQFSPGGADLAPDPSEALERLAVVLRWDPVLIATVQGQSGGEDRKALARTDGEKETLERLANRRAEAIRARLVEGLGIAADRVVVAPAGSGAPAARIEMRPREETS
jgi:Domain of Unknown Function (DUF748)/OmpA family